MKKINIQFLKKSACFIVFIIVLLVFGSYVRLYVTKEANKYLENTTTFAKNVDSNNKLLIKFIEYFPKCIVLLACSEDITGDGIKDLVVIGRFGDEIQTIALIDLGYDRYELSKPISAPKENQHIKFFNMDKVGANEVLITGEYKGKIGYAIYRYDDNNLIDIFGEGMEDCC